MAGLPIADVTLDNVIAAIKPHWAVRTDTAERMARKLSRIFTYAEVLKLRTGDPADQKYLSHATSERQSSARKTSRGDGLSPCLFYQLSESDTASAKALQWVMLSACRSAEGGK